MSKRKPSLDEASGRLTDILMEHLEKLPLSQQDRRIKAFSRAVDQELGIWA